MECNKEQNLKNCNCSYPGCSGCCFPDDVERTYDRSFKAFAQAWNL
ncbi:MAG: hypothetical protein ACYTFW_26595 [Planctomycetota bacterium]